MKSVIVSTEQASRYPVLQANFGDLPGDDIAAVLQDYVRAEHNLQCIRSGLNGSIFLQIDLNIIN